MLYVRTETPFLQCTLCTRFSLENQRSRLLQDLQTFNSDRNVTLTNKTVQSVEKLLWYIDQCVLSVIGYTVNVHRGARVPDAISNVSVPRTERFIAK